VAALRGRYANLEDRKAMLQILERVHQEQSNNDAGETVTSLCSSQSTKFAQHVGHDSDDSESDHDCLLSISPATLQALAEEQVDVSNIPPEDLASLQRMLARTNVSSLVAMWEPWWLSLEASAVRLRPDGTRLVTPLTAETGLVPWPPDLQFLLGHGSGDPKSSLIPPDDCSRHANALRREQVASAGAEGHLRDKSFSDSQTGCAAQEVQRHASSNAVLEAAISDGTVAEACEASSCNPHVSTSGSEEPLPRPPDTPVLPLTHLCSSPVAPQLNFVLLQAFCAYCYCERVYNGDWSCDPEGWMHLLWSLCSYLPAPANRQELPESVGAALTAIAAALQLPPAKEKHSAKTVRMLADDCAAVLGAGRGAMLCILADAGRRHCLILRSHTRGQRIWLHSQLEDESRWTGPGVDLPKDAATLPEKAQQRERHCHMHRSVRVRKWRSCAVEAVRKLVFLTSVANDMTMVALEELKIAVQVYLREVDAVRAEGVVG
jgi:hypothetical protein